MTGVSEAAGPAWSRRRTLVQNPNRSGVRSVITTVKRPPSVSRPGRPASRPGAWPRLCLSPGTRGVAVLGFRPTALGVFPHASLPLRPSVPLLRPSVPPSSPSVRPPSPSVRPSPAAERLQRGSLFPQWGVSFCVVERWRPSSRSGSSLCQMRGLQTSPPKRELAFYPLT